MFQQTFQCRALSSLKYERFTWKYNAVIEVFKSNYLWLTRYVVTTVCSAVLKRDLSSGSSKLNEYLIYKYSHC